MFPSLTLAMEDILLKMIFVFYFSSLSFLTLAKTLCFSSLSFFFFTISLSFPPLNSFHPYLYYIGLNIHLVPIFFDFIQFGPYFRFMFN